MGAADGTFWLITGPNMAGKSTFIRQTAILVLLAHLGSFIPAKSATIGMADRILVMREGRLVGELGREAAGEEAVMALAGMVGTGVIETGPVGSA